MKILVVNCGSSSIKYKLYSFPKQELLTKGLIERIGEKGSEVKTHKEGIRCLFSKLIENKAVKDLSEIDAIGHRVVHGAETFQKPHIIDNRVIKEIAKCCQLAPLHNPANLEGIISCRKILPKISQVAVFDTAFHQTIPQRAYLYAIPFYYYKKYKIRKYGFHGTSHQFVAHQAAKILKKPLQKLNLITCHLGNGCSITAIKNGLSIDTSMGFTPLEGLIMGTRCGDIDPAAIFYIMEKEKLTTNQMYDILNKKSGLLGISCLSNDFRILKKEQKSNIYAKLALDMFIYRIKKYIGAYMLILGKVDAICFTAGIGENNPEIIFQIKQDIHKILPKTKILVIPTDEELMIAKLTYQLIKE
ncbi:MAG: acetate kinase [Candidatus Omnitrophica bacterium]|nr:acetate kinase [Candidatus Omnitrophota bacterium]